MFGELIPFLALIAIILAVVAALYARKIMDRKQVVKSIDEMDMVERVKIPLTAKQVEILSKKLSVASEEATASKKPVILDHLDTDDRIIRFTISVD